MTKITAKQVIAQQEMAYGVITDDPNDPIGIAIGFDPTDHFDIEIKPVKLISDDGGNNVFITNQGIIISSKSELDNQQPDQNMWLWREPEEFVDWAENISGVAYNLPGR